MRTLLVLTFTMALLRGAFAQGTVLFITRLPSGIPPYYSQVFFGVEYGSAKTGNTAQNLPAGTQVYQGSPVTGSAWSAQLFSIPGNTIPSGPYNQFGVPVEDTFVASAPITTFRTGTAAGNVAVRTATLANVASDAPYAVLQMRVFPTAFGTWENAIAWANAGFPGPTLTNSPYASPPFVVNYIGGDINVPPQLTCVSFELPLVPEPSVHALASLGVVAFVQLRRSYNRPKR